MNSTFCSSLERSSHWSTTGGKSKAAFFKTHNDKIILKQLTTGWTLAEKSALLKFAPKYLDYITTTIPTILAKIFGFYAITVKATKEYSMDLNLMEHLFCGADISKKFDLKGVTNRISSCATIMLDTDWSSGHFSNQFPLSYHCKEIMSKSIYNDTTFLASQNIMDYSLLVGVSSQSSTLVCGIVDYIGPYTLFKSVESQTKTLRNGRATVIPPLAYSARFCTAMDNNFIGVPDYWTRL